MHCDWPTYNQLQLFILIADSKFESLKNRAVTLAQGTPVS